LDSDNDGIYDVVETGNAALDIDNDGRIDMVQLNGATSGPLGTLINSDLIILKHNLRLAILLLLELTETSMVLMTLMTQEVKLSFLFLLVQEPLITLTPRLMMIA